MNSDRISLRGIEVSTRIGVPESERAKPQRLLVDVELMHSLKPVAESDDVSKGIDYAEVVAVIQELAKTERKTVERFAEEIADALLKNFHPKGGVKISVHKYPALPIVEAIITIVRP